MSVRFWAGVGLAVVICLLWSALHLAGASVGDTAFLLVALQSLVIALVAMLAVNTRDGNGK